jgi:hypothetical protein
MPCVRRRLCTGTSTVTTGVRTVLTAQILRTDQHWAANAPSEAEVTAAGCALKDKPPARGAGAKAGKAAAKKRVTFADETDPKKARR